jgi:hypothetical protein
MIKVMGVDDPGSLTRGVVGDTLFGVMPDVSPGVTFAITLVVMTPFLVKVFRKPGFYSFVDGIVACGFASFLFGWVWCLGLCLMSVRGLHSQ